MSRQYIVTGSAFGIGAATAEKLRSDGHRVIGADIENADIIADLGTREGRAELIRQAEELSNGVINGVISVAGIYNLDPATLAVNYFGAIETLIGLRPLLARAQAPRAAVVSSGAVLAPTDGRMLEFLLNGDEKGALDYARDLNLVPDESGLLPILYPTSKLGVARWVRREAAKPEWAGAGIALNAVAPGIIRTRLNVDILATKKGLAALSAGAPAPFNGPAAPPAAVANLLAWLAGDENLFVTGQVIFIDGGAESIARPEFV